MRTFDLMSDLTRILQTNAHDICHVFRGESFHLLGFADGEENKSRQSVRNMLSKVIRRGNGTIYWDLNEKVTMLIVHDECDSDIRQV